MTAVSPGGWIPNIFAESHFHEKLPNKKWCQLDLAVPIYPGGICVAQRSLVCIWFSDEHKQLEVCV
jgi:hypothetical protein